ncbi:GntR family transcriptional regulator [Pseudohoeflea sp. DP4N28-3]|uniref:GntR family transcriptional regulator n=1 Tax=Pseudohoeflea coraliihabitans TaxID=2860393 RepID=A0ABS6WL04_9HYPH|nr:GntR family transcriptional regulator [Pseudohoeflea sp. DP4N28-3]MBW3096639.1 GntR family transcriptional regulator [Pseudohoeflea sp. DP4N28-3]
MDHKPLYARIRDRLVGRLVSGSWTPGMLIPSEMELARQLGVSQGTVRKALDLMTAENLLIRRQGRGTFVAVPDEGRKQFQFFRLVPDSGEHLLPESRVTRRDTAAADAAEAAALAISRAAPVCRVERLRLLAGKPLLVETLSVPKARLDGFEALETIPNNIYGLYAARWGITIAGATEKLKAIAASKTDAALLGCATGEPLLCIERVAVDLENTPVEWRVSRCLTGEAHYLAELR